MTNRWKSLGLFPAVLSLMAAQAPQAQPGRTFGTAGKEKTVLKAGVEAELFHYAAKGFLTHMWFGGDFKDYGLTRIRVYVDGERTASIDMELMMGHGIGFQDGSAPWGVERIGKQYETLHLPANDQRQRQQRTTPALGEQGLNVGREILLTGVVVERLLFQRLQ